LNLCRNIAELANWQRRSLSGTLEAMESIAKSDDEQGNKIADKALTELEAGELRKLWA